jgi:hypothetical protein
MQFPYDKFIQDKTRTELGLESAAQSVVMRAIPAHIMDIFLTITLRLDGHHYNIIIIIIIIITYCN